MSLFPVKGLFCKPLLFSKLRGEAPKACRPPYGRWAYRLFCSKRDLQWRHIIGKRDIQKSSTFIVYSELRVETRGCVVHNMVADYVVTQKPHRKQHAPEPRLWIYYILWLLELFFVCLFSQWKVSFPSENSRFPVKGHFLRSPLLSESRGEAWGRVVRNMFAEFSLWGWVRWSLLCDVYTLSSVMCIHIKKCPSRVYTKRVCFECKVCTHHTEIGLFCRSLLLHEESVLQVWQCL